jgi:predicted ATP-binding protein involved in virulence
MHIDALKLRDIGPFKDATITFPKGSDSGLADVYLLTGPNGVGKSTALYAIADCVGGEWLNSSLSESRAVSDSSLLALASGNEHVAWTWKRKQGNQISQIPDPFDGDSHPQPVLGTNVYNQKAWGRFVGQGTVFERYAHNAQQFKGDAPRHSQTQFTWAVFAYAGQRAMTNVKLNAIQEPLDSPFEKSLSFFQTSDTSKLLNWIANQDFKRLKLQERGEAGKAQAFGANVQIIEKAIREIMGADFGFDTSGEDVNVRIRWNGAVTGIEVLPDGLKSILSWVADLLMRLDRIPWENDMPVLGRSFLLLLDEIDIHLHPAWQRKVLPIVQKLFPNAQIIATTHSPFVVASVEDAYVISLKLDETNHAVVDKCEPARLGVSYSAVLRSIFGIDSEFDVDTEKLFNDFHAAKSELLSDASSDRAKVDEIAKKLKERSEEAAALVGIELRQLERQLAGAARK